MQEYWAAEIRPLKPNYEPELLAELMELGREHFDNPYGSVPECRHTRRMKHMFHAAHASMNAVMAELGIPARQVSIDRMHVVMQSEYDAKFKTIPISLACSRHGHMFLPHTDNVGIAEFLSLLVHELSHLMGYTCVLVGQRPRNPMYNWRRVTHVGLIEKEVSHYGEGTMVTIKSASIGAGEAVTEIVKQRTYEHMFAADKTGDYSMSHNFLPHMNYYVGQVAAVRAVFARIAFSLGHTCKHLEDLMCVEHFVGPWSLYQKIEQFDFRLLVLFRDMCRSAASVASVHSYLGEREHALKQMIAAHPDTDFHINTEAA